MVGSCIGEGARVLDVARSLDDFLRILAPFNQRALAEMVRVKVDRPAYLFRGCKANQELVASVGKPWRDDLDRCERNMLRFLREQYEGMDSLSDWDLIAIARHHGVPTRYLDWSSNALVALRFALGGRSGNISAPVVWVLETRSFDFDIPKDDAGPLPRGIGSSTKIYAPSAVDSRIVRQDSYMMRQVFVQKGDSCEIEPVNENPTFEKRIWQIGIDVDAAESMVTELENLGYTFKALLPEINFKNLKSDCDEIMKGMQI